MDMESLFPLLILAIWLFSSFSRKKAKKRDSVEKPAGKLKASIQDFFQQIKAEIEKAQAGQQPPPATEAASFDLPAAEDLWIEPTVEIPPEPPAAEPPVVRPAVPAAASTRQPPRSPEPALSLPLGDPELLDLETAMIWHEILSPPVSCRPDSG